MTAFLMIEEVAHELAVPRKWVLERIRTGELACYKMGHRTFRVKREDLDTFIAKSFIPATDTEEVE